MTKKTHAQTLRHASGTPTGRRRAIEWKFRKLTAGFRQLPDFVIVGAAKAGSTSLYDYLSEHPRISPAFRKEVHYFDQNSDMGEDWYRAHFPIDFFGTRKTLTGEATPYYCFHPGVAPQVAKLLPDAKIIFILREPISRAFSHHQQNIRRNIDTLQFSDAIASEEERISDLHRRLRDHYVKYAADHQNFSYGTRGKYIEQIEDWLKYYPRHKILVVFTEELQEFPGKVLRQVTRFLEIEDFSTEVSPKKSNSGRYRLDISQDVLQHLRLYYEKSNEKLAQFVGRKLPWKEVDPAPDRIVETKKEMD